MKKMRKVSYLVVALHLFIFCSFLFNQATLPKKHHIAVRAVRLQPQPPSQSSQQAVAQHKSLPPVSARKSVPIAPEKKPVATALPKVAPAQKQRAPVAKKTKKNPAVSQQLIRELEESIAKIDAKPDKLKSEKCDAKGRVQESMPLVLSSLDIGSSVRSPDEIKELFVLELKNSLRLPDFGEVTMKIVLRSNGSVAKVEVLRSVSKKNSVYLERELPRLLFPFVTEFRLKEDERNFVITFCNDL